MVAIVCHLGKKKRSHNFSSSQPEMLHTLQNTSWALLLHGSLCLFCSEMALMCMTNDWTAVSRHFPESKHRTNSNKVSALSWGCREKDGAVKDWWQQLFEPLNSKSRITHQQRMWGKEQWQGKTELFMGYQQYCLWSHFTLHYMYDARLSDLSL